MMGLLLGDEALFVPYSEFPWFKKATIEEMSSIEWPAPDHLYWPLIDVDLSVKSKRNPSEFPLQSRA